MKLTVNYEQVKSLWGIGVLSEKNRLYLRRLGFTVSRREWSILIRAQKGTIKWETQCETLQGSHNIKLR